MNSPQALSLDLDATLLDGSGLPDSIDETCRRIADAFPSLDASLLIAANAAAWEAYWPTVETRWELGQLDGAAVRLEAWRRTLQACRLDDSAAVQFAAHTHARLARDAHRLFDDALDLLRSANAARIPLALITNGASDTQREKLQALNLEGWFDAVIISGEVGAAKPDGSVFDAALADINVPRDRVWHVGDSLTSDVTGARAAGLVSVWLNRTGARPTPVGPAPDLEISSLADLRPWF